MTSRRYVQFCLAVAVLLVGFGGPLFVVLARGQEPVDPAKKNEPTDKNEPEASPLAADYGFQPLELFKFTDRIEGLRAGDLNEDGRRDLLMYDNGNSRIDVLLQRDLKQAAKIAPEKLEINEFASDLRFEHLKIPVDRKIDALVHGDFNGDQHPDLAYAGENHLMVRLGTAAGKWDDPRSVRLGEEVTARWHLELGDVDRDGLDDLVLMGSGETLIYRGNRQGMLENVERLLNTTDRFVHFWLEDLEGDGRLDLLYFDSDNLTHPLVVRWQNPKGKFGPEYRLRLPMPRALDLAHIKGRPGRQLVTIEQKTGRAQAFSFHREALERDSPTSPFVQFGLSRASSGRNRFLATGDVNGDGLTDVVIADGDAALMSVFLQDPETGLSPAVDFPGLTGLRGLALADFDGDQRAEVIVASEREKVIAISSWRGGRLTFPTGLPSVDTPMAMTLADFGGKGTREIAYISSSKGMGLARSKFVLRTLTYDPDDGWQPGSFNGEDFIELAELRSAPAELLAVDADRDGRSDLMLIGNSDPVLFLTTNGQGVPRPTSAETNSRLGNVAPGQITLGQVDGPAILISQNNFARRVRLGADGQWAVVDQFNAESTNAKIAGTAILDLDGDGQAEIVLVDTGTRRLRFLRKVEGVYRPWKDLEIGSFAYRSLEVADFNNDKKDDLILFAPDRFGVIFPGDGGPDARIEATYETKLRDCRFGDLVAGDLGGGDETELALIDTTKKRIEIITPRKGTWEPALTFFVIETSQFHPTGGSEPRQALVADVTSDNLPDLILIAHDRILLYPQDPGPSEDPPATEKQAQVPPPEN